MSLVGAGLCFRGDCQAERDAVAGNERSEGVETGAIEFEEVLKGMFVRGRRNRGHSPKRLGRLGKFQPWGQESQICLESFVVPGHRHRQMEYPAVQPRADHQAPGMLDAEGFRLLLEIDQIDVHRVKAERKRQFDQFTGPSRQWQADRAEIAKHPKWFSFESIAGGKADSRPRRSPKVIRQAPQSR